ncbi:MAG: T9SS type A sorting domain-containing protein [Bacteroidetes bacterium]|nr:T9SS type A sorting domain-containing protein [Bacteroidota bacterium]
MKTNLPIHFYLLFLACLAFTAPGFAQDGTLDPTFNGTGFQLLSDSGSLHNRGSSVARQTDGKLIACGYAEFIGLNNYFTVVTRYNTNGTLDSSFGYNGIVHTRVDSVGSEGAVVRIQSDNKILIYANAFKINQDRNPLSTVLIRYLPNGDLDSTFGTNGITQRVDVAQYASASQLLIQPDHKILVAASDYSDAFIARFTASGQLDSSFSHTGVFQYNVSFNFTSVAGMLLDPNQKLIVVGTGSNGGNMFYYIRRFTADGIPDSTYSDDGITNELSGDYRGTRISAIGYQSNGKIILAGDQGYDPKNLLMIRYNADLTFDNSFDTAACKVRVNGELSRSKSAVVLADNRIAVVAVIGDDYDKLAVVRFNANGGYDNSFGTGGYFKGPEVSVATEILEQADGKVAFVCGEWDSINSRRIQSVYRLRNTTVMGLEEVDENTSARLYPNPTTGRFRIASDKEVESIRVFDLLGKEMAIQLLGNNEANASGYPAGIYQVEALMRDKSSIHLKMLLR